MAASFDSIVLDSTAAHFKLLEANANGLTIDIHIISPGWGSSGYYSESVLQKACTDGVYPQGMHMHIDHPTRESEKSQPARTIKGVSPLAAVFEEAAHYEANGWDGPGPYTIARVLPQYVEDLKAMGGHIGISHYVSGVAKAGEAEGRKGQIITELLADALNTVDFVTVPGAGGHYKTLGEAFERRRDDEQKSEGKNMADEPKRLTLKEIQTDYPEYVKQIAEQAIIGLESDKRLAEQAKKLTEAEGKLKEQADEIKTLKAKAAEAKATEYVAAEITKAKLPEASAKILTESLVKQVIIAEDGGIDALKFAEVVKAAIEAKTAEVEAIRKESGIRGNGGSAPATEDGHKALVESLTSMYLMTGKSKEEAAQLAELAAGGR
jgi:L-lactate utilization protein LutC